MENTHTKLRLVDGGEHESDGGEHELPENVVGNNEDHYVVLVGLTTFIIPKNFMQEDIDLILIALKKAHDADFGGDHVAREKHLKLALSVIKEANSHVLCDIVTVGNIIFRLRRDISDIDGVRAVLKAAQGAYDLGNIDGFETLISTASALQGTEDNYFES